ncbi:hypothetical protein ACF06W_22385 [Streptomyces albus]|uniref:hypothetical protein n=1 Tax=Streptomyces albus TaxID=1888 RepID=UPI0036F518CF
MAHPASTEAGIIGRQATHCPALAATPLLDTLRLAKTVVPGPGSYGLDGLLGYYGIPKPAVRHGLGGSVHPSTLRTVTVSA